MTGIMAKSLGATTATVAGGRLAVGAGAAQVVNQGAQLHNDWQNLTPEQRAQHTAELATGIGMMTTPLANRAMPEGGIRSFDEVPGTMPPAGGSRDGWETFTPGAMDSPTVGDAVAGANPRGAARGATPTPLEAQTIVEAAEPIGNALKSDAYHRAASFAVRLPDPERRRPENPDPSARRHEWQDGEVRVDRERPAHVRAPAVRCERVNQR